MLHLPAIWAASSASSAAAEPLKVSIDAFGARPDEDARPAILRAVEFLGRKGGGTVTIPSNGQGGWWISNETRVTESNIRIELLDNLRLTSTTPSSGLSFIGTPSKPLVDVSLICPDRKQRIDGNGRNMKDFQYIPGPSFPAVHFAHCHRPLVSNIHAFNGLVNSLLFEFCGDIVHIDCDGSHAEYDNGISVNFYPLYRRKHSSPKHWTNSHGIRPRAWRNRGVGIALYAACGNQLDAPTSWNNGNDIQGFPTNGGGISIEHNTASTDRAIAGRDSKTVIKSALVYDNLNIGILVTANGVTLLSPRLSGTLRPKDRDNATSAYGSNLLIFGHGSVIVSDGLSEESEQHGVVMLATTEHGFPRLQWDGIIARSYGHGIWGRGVNFVELSQQSSVHSSGYRAVTPMSNVRIDNSGRYNRPGAKAVIQGHLGANRVTLAMVELDQPPNIWAG